MPGGERFPPAARIRSSREIREVFREGRRRRSGPLEVFARPSDAGRPRLALVVPRHGRTIVERNRLKRRLREIARRGWLPRALDAGWQVDAVVRAGSGAYGLPFDELRSILLDLLDGISCDVSS